MFIIDKAARQVTGGGHEEAVRFLGDGPQQVECRMPQSTVVGLQESTSSMTKIFRTIIGYMVVSPFVVASNFLSILLGQEKAIKIIGPRLTKSAKRSLRFWIPKIDDAKDFDSFPAKMKKNFRLWKPLFDIEISEESNDVFKLRVSNCPFCEALNRLEMSKLSPYVCEGDWAIARDNADKWKFERKCQIGTGDSYCDHTYKRIYCDDLS